jgi:alpha-D-ribose 1-methylphosphonate 5-triphosphate synthase subunit PhnG
MNRKKRTEILLKGSITVPWQLAQAILANHEVRMVEAANSGAVMVKVRESAKGSLFYLGEVLITECKVMLDGQLGIGMVKGYDEDLAYYLAVIDAAYNAGLPETPNWTAVLLEEEKRIKRENDTLQREILKTKVNFETMDTQASGGEA